MAKETDPTPKWLHAGNRVAFGPKKIACVVEFVEPWNQAFPNNNNARIIQVKQPSGLPVVISFATWRNYLNEIIIKDPTEPGDDIPGNPPEDQ